MGIDISSKLLLVPSVDIHSALNEYAEEDCHGDFWQAVDDKGLDYASPRYDSSPDDWVVGVSLPRPTYEDLLDQESEWWDSLNKAKDLLTSICGECDCTLTDAQHVY